MKRPAVPPWNGQLAEVSSRYLAGHQETRGRAMMVGRNGPAGLYFDHKLTICFVRGWLSWHHQKWAGFKSPPATAEITMNSRKGLCCISYNNNNYNLHKKYIFLFFLLTGQEYFHAVEKLSFYFLDHFFPNFGTANKRITTESQQRLPSSFSLSLSTKCCLTNETQMIKAAILKTTCGKVSAVGWIS